MRAVLDTNVLISAIFFGGTPGKVIQAWRDGEFELVVSPAILQEYRRVAAELSARHRGIDISPILDLVTIHALVVEDRVIRERISRDPDDDKFLMCAGAAGAVVVSGDRDLLAADGALGVCVLSPRKFLSDLSG